MNLWGADLHLKKLRNTYMNINRIKIYLKILKLRLRVFYVRYVKIIVLAIMEVIADFYSKKYDKR